MTNVFKALADPTRRRILQLLKVGPLTAGEITQCFDLSKPTMSAHFGILREAELIGSEKDGKHVVYWLNASVIEEALLGFANTLDLGFTAAAEKPARSKT